MSKIAKPSRLAAPAASRTPNPNAGPRPSRPSTSAAKTPGIQSGAKKVPTKGPAKPKEKKPEFAVPAFSIAPQKPKAQIDWELVKHDMARRQAPEGEDVQAIKKLLQEMSIKKVPVHDFINLVSPYTSDNGAVLRTVMAQDVDSFRKLARKVYETMTQDVSDVLVNEQLNMIGFYEERHDLFTDKMMNAINEIYEMAPNFDFQRYLKDKQDYLNYILPLPVDHHKDEAEIEMQKRQQAYHRLLWLRSEGERMSAENKRLQERLHQLKSQQEREQQTAAEVAAEAETQRQHLVQEEAKVKDKLDTLNKSVEKSFVQNEALANQQHTREVMAKAPLGKGKKKGPVKKKKVKRPEWVSEVATDIEQEAIDSVIAAEAESVAPAVTVRKPNEPPPHYSPIRPLLSPRQRIPQMQAQGEPMQQPLPIPERQQQQMYQRQQAQRQLSPQMSSMQSRQVSPPQVQPPHQRQTSPQMQPMQQRQPSPQMQPRQPSPQMQRQMQQLSPQAQPVGQMQLPPQTYQGQAPILTPQPMQQRQETRIEQAATTTQLQRGRRVQGPRDTWRGFFG